MMPTLVIVLPLTFSVPMALLLVRVVLAVMLDCDVAVTVPSLILAVVL